MLLSALLPSSPSSLPLMGLSPSSSSSPPTSPFSGSKCLQHSRRDLPVLSPVSLVPFSLSPSPSLPLVGRLLPSLPSPSHLVPVLQLQEKTHGRRTRLSCCRLGYCHRHGDRRRRCRRRLKEQWLAVSQDCKPIGSSLFNQLVHAHVYRLAGFWGAGEKGKGDRITGGQGRGARLGGPWIKC